MGTKVVGLVGQITKNCNVAKLRMAYCDLKHEELDSFMKHSNGAKVRKFYLRVKYLRMVFMELKTTTVLCAWVGYTPGCGRE